METRNNSIHGDDDKKKKKGERSSATHVFRVALYMMRRKRNQPSPKANLHPTIWRRFVGSIRPLHSPEIPTTPPPQAKITKTPSKKKATVTVTEEEEEEEAFTPRVSPFASSSSTSGTSSVGTDSRYASAVNLKEMDRCDDDDDEDGDGGHGGDDMIDAKADEFIARFYTQMRMQNQAPR